MTAMTRLRNALVSCARRARRDAALTEALTHLEDWRDWGDPTELQAAIEILTGVHDERA